VSGALLSVRAAGLAGWQWLFVVEGAPAIVLGFVVLGALTEHPRDARWLTEEERDAIERSVIDAGGPPSDNTPLAALRRTRTWLLALVYFTIPVMLYGLGFWMPQMLKRASGGGDFGAGLLTAIPYGVAAATMVIVGRHSDRVDERRWHLAGAAAVAGVAVALAPLGTTATWTVATLAIAMAGLASMFGPFWALATASGSGAAAAASIALINSVGNIGGFVGPYLLGAIEDETHSFAAGLYAIGALMVAGGALALTVRQEDGAVRRHEAAG
jgi:sugar phosphate permease